MVVADVHAGATPYKELKTEFISSILSELNTHKDFIVFCGDLFDSKMYANNPNISLIIELIGAVVEICRVNGTKIRMVYGTESHESNQYQIFQPFIDDNTIDFKIVYTAQSEELLPNLNVLYLPEEYITDENEYFSSFKSETRYDYIFGHGVIKDMMRTSQVSQNSDTKKLKVPQFSSAALSEICSGDVFFGHYHCHTTMNENVHYIGSFSRWCFGEDEDKGFMICSVDDNAYSTSFIKNEFVKTYKTISFGYDSDIFKSTDSFIKSMDEVSYMIKTDVYDYIRLMVNIPELHENAQFIVDFLKNRFRDGGKVKVNIINGFIDKQHQIDKEAISKVVSEYDFIFDKSVPVETKISIFIKKKHNKEISANDIKSYLEKTI